MKPLLTSRPIRRLAVIISVLLLGSGHARSQMALDSELRNKSEVDGLGLVQFSNRELLMIPFGAKPHSITFFGLSVLAARSSPDGRHFVIYTGDRDNRPSAPPYRLALVDTRGRVLSSLRRDVTNIVDMSMSLDCQKVAFLGQDLRTKETGLFYGNMGSDQAVLAVPMTSLNGVPKESSIGWGADGKRIVFENAKQVYTYDIYSKQIESIVQGAEPSWSPNGVWIAYRSGAGVIHIISSDLKESKIVGGGKKSISGAHWSPDSAYVFVAENWPEGKNPNCYENDRLVVYRISDSARTAVHDPCAKKDSLFGWIIDRDLVKTTRLHGEIGK
jgi:Tol biopolymer transport system component